MGSSSQPLPCLNDPNDWRDCTFSHAPFNDTFARDLFNSTKLEKYTKEARLRVDRYLELREEMRKTLDSAQHKVNQLDTLAEKLQTSKDPDDLCEFFSK